VLFAKLSTYERLGAFSASISDRRTAERYGLKSSAEEFSHTRTADHASVPSAELRVSGTGNAQFPPQLRGPVRIQKRDIGVRSQRRAAEEGSQRDIGDSKCFPAGCKTS
jgi:hypothetical protein